MVSNRVKKFVIKKKSKNSIEFYFENSNFHVDDKTLLKIFKLHSIIFLLKFQVSPDSVMFEKYKIQKYKISFVKITNQLDNETN